MSLDPLSIPCCPFCDNAIEEWDKHKIVAQHGSKFLAHAHCDAEDKEDDEETEA
jgi:hypothetical protein